MTKSPSKNIWDEFTKASKIGPSIEIFNADFFNFPPKLLKVLFWVAS